MLNRLAWFLPGARLLRWVDEIGFLPGVNRVERGSAGQPLGAPVDGLVISDPIPLLS